MIKSKNNIVFCVFGALRATIGLLQRKNCLIFLKTFKEIFLPFFFLNLFFPPDSDESPERPASPWQRDPGDVVQTPGGAAASWRGGARRTGADSGLLRLCPPPLQKAWLQKL